MKLVAVAVAVAEAPTHRTGRGDWASSHRRRWGTPEIQTVVLETQALPQTDWYCGQSEDMPVSGARAEC